MLNQHKSTFFKSFDEACLLISLESHRSSRGRGGALPPAPLATPAPAYTPLTTTFFFFFFFFDPRIYFFREPFLMVADPEMIKEILVKEFPKFHDRKVRHLYAVFIA